MLSVTPARLGRHQPIESRDKRPNGSFENFTPGNIVNAIYVKFTDPRLASSCWLIIRERRKILSIVPREERHGEIH